jgi:hypothetical protein
MKASIVSDRLAGLDQPARVAEGAELQGEAEPVPGASPPAEQGDVLIAEDVEPEVGGLVRGQPEQRRPLPVGEDRAVGHEGLG